MSMNIHFLQYALRLFYVAIAVGLSAFVGKFSS